MFASKLNPRGNPFPGLGRWGAMFQRMLPNLRRRSALDGALEHLGNVPLTAHASLALVRLYDDTLLLGVTPQSITLLSKGVDPSAFVAQRRSHQVGGDAESTAETENVVR